MVCQALPLKMLQGRPLLSLFHFGALPVAVTQCTAGISSRSDLRSPAPHCKRTQFGDEEGPRCSNATLPTKQGHTLGYWGSGPPMYELWRDNATHNPGVAFKFLSASHVYNK